MYLTYAPHHKMQFKFKLEIGKCSRVVRTIVFERVVSTRFYPLPGQPVEPMGAAPLKHRVGKSSSSR